MADFADLMMAEKAKKEEQKQNSQEITKQSPFANSLANQQISKEVNQKDSKLTNQQANKPVSKFTNKEVSQQASNLVKQQTTKEKKKYGTYLREASISAIQILAIQKRLKDHEVLQEIVDDYFSRRK